jgi:hypothetical protein
VEVDGVPVSREQAFTFELDQFSPADLKKAIADSERLALLLQEQPDEMTAILNDALAGRVEVATQNARRIGLTEEAFQESGGGLVLWCGIVVVGVLFFGLAAFTAPGSVAPQPDAGTPSDAGVPSDAGAAPG